MEEAGVRDEALGILVALIVSGIFCVFLNVSNLLQQCNNKEKIAFDLEGERSSLPELSLLDVFSPHPGKPAFCESYICIVYVLTQPSSFENLSYDNIARSVNYFQAFHFR